MLAYVSEYPAPPLIDSKKMQETFKKSSRDKQYLKRIKREKLSVIGVDSVIDYLSKEKAVLEGKINFTKETKARFGVK